MSISHAFCTICNYQLITQSSLCLAEPLAGAFFQFVICAWLFASWIIFNDRLWPIRKNNTLGSLYLTACFFVVGHCETLGKQHVKESIEGDVSDKDVSCV